jgi:aminoglycoside 3-N-acetyltransferase
MAFQIYSTEQLREHLRCLGIRPGMKVVVHAALTAFGKIPGRQEAVFTVLKEAVGEDGLLMFPTFTFELDADKPFNKFKQAPTGMGALSNHVWNMPDVFRTNSCIHSYTGIGKGAGDLAQVKEDRSYGEGSFFDLAHKENFFWVMLGCPISEGCTLIHHVEAMHGVPYREWDTFSRKLENPDESVRLIDYLYYKRKDDFKEDTSFTPVRDAMIAKGVMILEEAPHGQSLSAYSADIVRCSMDLLDQNNMALILPTSSPDVARQ